MHIFVAWMMVGNLKRIQSILAILVITTAVSYISIEIVYVHYFLHDDACALPASWLPGPLHAETVSDMRDWSFQNIITCPKFTLYDAPFERKVVSLKCTEDNARLVTTISNKSADIFTVPYKDKCLLTFIDNCCLNGRTVPNVVHYVWFSYTKMDFFNFLSFISVVKFVKPCLILIHGPYLPHGDYWEFFLHAFPNVIHVQRNLTRTVKDKRLAYAEHGSDVMRIEALDAFGGLYLDWDEVVLRSVDKLRDRPMTMGLESGYLMGSQFIMAQRGTPFLKLWRHTYEINYRKTWTYNALEVPYRIAQQLPDTIHVEGHRFTRPSQMYLIYDQNFNWSDNYAMHLFSRWYRLAVAHKFQFNEKTIGLLNITLGSVARHILFGNKELCVNEGNVRVKEPS